MPIMPMRPILDAAAEKGYAQGAFNVNTTAQAQAIIEVHKMFRSAAIIQGADLANAFMGGRADFMNGAVEDKRKGAKRIADAVYRYAQDAEIPVALHLDHGRDIDSVKAAIDGGYTSVMIDGSSLPFGDNVELTREVVKYAHPLGVSVEGELGVLAGVEDHVSAANSNYTDPALACEFVQKTGVDCLAISYGTQHGAVKGSNVKLRREIAVAAVENLRFKGINALLVSHGSSTVPQYIVERINALGGAIKNANGIPIEELKAVIGCGIRKINVDTDIRLAVTRNFREYFTRYQEKRKSPSVGAVWELMEKNPDKFDPRVFLPPVMEPMITETKITDPDLLDLVELVKAGVKEVVGALIVSFGSIGHAGDVEIKSLEQMALFYNQKG
ncbi:MAG: class II fructose-bisphosphate aldolase [Treponema sp.]|jgi:fructose-bisphosphate aldolase class II|nr:class II fructose-bisphosphate aldolase [Treponema sp.]